MVRLGSHVHPAFEWMVVVAMMDLHPTKPAEKGRIAVLSEAIGVLGPLASGLSIGPKETSDGAKLDLSSFREVHPGRVGRFGEGLS